MLIVLRWCMWVVAVAACGRVDFDELVRGDAAGDGADAGDAGSTVTATSCTGGMLTSAERRERRAAVRARS